MKTLLKQYWTESEKGWGTRPDGYSLHLDKKSLEEYVKEYWRRMPNDVPDEYSRPEGTPILVDVDDHLFEEVKSTKFGLRRFSYVAEPHEHIDL